MNPLSASGRPSFFFWACLSVLTLTTNIQAAETALPRIIGIRTTNGLPLLSFPYPNVQEYQVFGSGSPTGPFTPVTDGVLTGPTYLITNGGPMGFYRVSATPMSSQDILAATVLSRLTYGPTPDDLAHIRTIGPEQFIEEQLATESIPENLDTQPPILNQPPAGPPATNWIRSSVSGPSTGTNFFIYLNAAGRVYLDDVRLVVGQTADVGENLLINGDFEDTLTNGWKVGALFARSAIVPSPTPDGLAASGTNCLLMASTGAGTGNNASLQQPYAITNPPGTVYTLSFSYLAVPNPGSTNVGLVARLTGAETANVGANRTIPLPWTGPVPPTPPPSVSPLYAKLNNAAPPLNNSTVPDVFVTLADLRSYHILRAVQSKRQLYEVMVQFFENHFTTEYTKIDDYFDLNFARQVTNASVRANLAVDLEWREHQLFRQALLNPNCTFYDLLKISVESPAMIIYLDTVLSTRTAANENYARELLELHTFGADNGYIQQDIVDLAKVWTGWRVAKKDPSNANNPHAPGVSNATNDLGVWVLHFSTNAHNYTAVKRLFTNNVIDPRFGPSFGGGQPYSMIISNNAFPGTNGMNEGYQVIRHLSELPYTAEFLSVKLCRVFVHEDFDFGIYDYTANPLSPEAQLIKDCMTAWMTPGTDGRKGHIRSVLRTIFASELFRSQSAAQQKVKTPLEFSIGAVRALRVSDTDGSGYVTTTADTDGASLVAPLNRMGGMSLFNKPEPDGYSEFGQIWLNTANLDERWRFVQNLLMASNYGLKNTDYGATRNASDPSRLIRLRLPSSSWNDPAAVVDYFISILYPGEGAANLAEDRAAAIQFLNTNDAGQPSPFSFATQDGRVRGMVALLMCLPRYQEQ
jgi:uncharacterized protein (DUF1800 family)